jgi:hypothetical protein
LAAALAISLFADVLPAVGPRISALAVGFAVAKFTLILIAVGPRFNTNTLGPDATCGARGKERLCPCCACPYNSARKRNSFNPKGYRAIFDQKRPPYTKNESEVTFCYEPKCIIQPNAFVARELDRRNASWSSNFYFSGREDIGERPAINVVAGGAVIARLLEMALVKCCPNDRKFRRNHFGTSAKSY